MPFDGSSGSAAIRKRIGKAGDRCNPTRRVPFQRVVVALGRRRSGGTAFAIMTVRGSSCRQRARAIHLPCPTGRLCAPLLGSVFLGLALGGCSNASILVPQGAVAAENRTILLDSLGIMLAIVVPTIVGTLAFAWWFRASNDRAKFRPD